MSTDPQVTELLLQWEELRDQGRAVSLEELCRDCPHLLEEVRAQARKLQALDPVLQAPRGQTSVDGPARASPIDSTLSGSGSDSRPRSAGPVPLPVIPGYELLGELGRGGMGVVYKARQASLGRLVALKMLLAEPYTSPAQRQRFKAEAEAVARLRHPNIIQIHDIGEVAGRAYCALEYVEGGSLADALAGQPCPPRVAAELLAVLADAVQAAHECGVIHRDLKPANVLLQRNSTTDNTDGTDKDKNKGSLSVPSVLSVVDCLPRITDFGLAKDLGAEKGLTETGQVLGTPSYMAPEQALGRNVDVGPAADVYSLGVILYECLTGRPPLVGPTALETLQRVLSQDPLPPRRLQPSVPRDLETVCLKCLAKEPHKRYASAAELAADLRRFLRGEPVRARRTRAWERALKWARRRPAAAALLVLGVLAGLGLLGGGLAYSAYQREQREESERLARRTEQDVKEAVHQVTLLRTQADTARGPLAAELRARARGQAQRARLLVENGPVAPDLERQVRGLLTEIDAEDRDRDLLADLDDAYLAQAEPDLGRFAWERAVPKFREAFRRYGLPAGEASPEAVAARLDGRPHRVRVAALGALDQWLRLAENRELKVREPHRAWLRAAVTAIDARAWAKEMRRANARLDPAVGRAALEKLADAADLKQASGRAVENLVKRLLQAGARDKGLALARRALVERPDDFWLNHTLAMEVMEDNPAEAERLLACAVTVRPENAAARAHLAGALNNQGKWEQAIAQGRKAVELGPRVAAAHNNLGRALRESGKPKEALKAFRRALALEPDNALYHSNLGLALWDLGEFQQALEAQRKAVWLQPDLAVLHNNLALSLQAAGWLKEAEATFEIATQLGPRYAPAYYNLAQLLRQQGRLDPAVTAYRKAIALNLKVPRVYVGLGEALFEQDKYAEAEPVFRQAVALDPNNLRALGGLANALARLGKYGENAAPLRKLLELLPADDPMRPKLEHNLRTCEAMVKRERDLPRILAHELRPENASELLGYIELCRRKSLHAAAARLYGDGLATYPALARNAVLGGHRLAAARFAALAGSGQGEDAQYLGPAERAAFRKRALDWLLADLKITRVMSRHRAYAVRLRAQKRLQSWQEEKDLAGIRDGEALDRLPAEERQTFQKFWDEIGTLLKESRALGKGVLPPKGPQKESRRPAPSAGPDALAWLGPVGSYRPDEPGRVAGGTVAVSPVVAGRKYDGR